MSSLNDINDFLRCKTIAIVGVSRKPSKFGNTLFRELSKKGYDTVPVNPYMNSFEGKTCYPNLLSIPILIDGAVISVPSDQSTSVVTDAIQKDVKRVWFQQGSESNDALCACRESRMTAVHGECILMFAEPIGFVHKIHRWICILLGKLPS